MPDLSKLDHAHSLKQLLPAIDVAYIVLMLFV